MACLKLMKHWINMRAVPQNFASLLLARWVPQIVLPVPVEQSYKEMRATKKSFFFKFVIGAKMSGTLTRKRLKKKRESIGRCRCHFPDSKDPKKTSRLALTLFAKWQFPPWHLVRKWLAQSQMWIFCFSSTFEARLTQLNFWSIALLTSGTWLEPMWMHSYHRPEVSSPFCQNDSKSNLIQRPRWLHN